MSTLKTTKIKKLIAPVDRENDSPELGVPGYFNLSELQTLLRMPVSNLSNNLTRDVQRFSYLVFGNSQNDKLRKIIKILSTSYVE